MSKLSVLIIDNSIYHRKVLSNAVEKTEFGEVAKVTSSGIIALERLSQTKIDIVLLNIELIDMDSIEVLKSIKNKYQNTQVIIFGKNTSVTAPTIKVALELGAIEFINKNDELDFDKNIIELSSILKMIFMNLLVQGKVKSVEIEAIKNTDKITCNDKPLIDKAKEFNIKPFGRRGPELILIASSTGGPVALEKVIAKIPKSFNKPVIIVQHMPEGFTKSFAESLSCKGGPCVIEAFDGEIVKPGKVMIAPGNCHIFVEEESYHSLIIRNEKSEPVNGVRPSADVLFRSVAKKCKEQRVLVVILTGMGKDGTDGLKEIKKNCNCYCITQSEETCVVYGMPKCVFDAGLSDEVVGLDSIGARINEISG